MSLLEVFVGLTGKEIPGQNSQEHYKHVNCILHSAATHLFKNAREKKKKYLTRALHLNNNFF